MFFFIVFFSISILIILESINIKKKKKIISVVNLIILGLLIFFDFALFMIFYIIMALGVTSGIFLESILKFTKTILNDKSADLNYINDVNFYPDEVRLFFTFLIILITINIIIKIFDIIKQKVSLKIISILLYVLILFFYIIYISFIFYE